MTGHAISLFTPASPQARKERVALDVKTAMTSVGDRNVSLHYNLLGPPSHTQSLIH